MNSFIDYVKDSYTELINKVTWITWARVQKLTVTVVVFSVIFSLLVWGIDVILERALKLYFDVI